MCLLNRAIIASLIRIDKPCELGIIIPALEVVHSDLFVKIVGSVAEGVNGSNAASRVVLHNGRHTPSIIAISADDATVLVGDCNDVSLQILLEVVGLTVVDNTADRVLIVIQRNQNILISLCLLIIVPALTQDLGAIQNVIMLDAAHSLAGTNTVGVVGIGVAVKPLQLAALLPGQLMAQTGGRITLLVTVYTYSQGMSISEKQPHPERCGCATLLWFSKRELTFTFSVNPI